MRLTLVEGRTPRYHIGAIAYFSNDVLRFYWRDPKPHENTPKKRIEVDVTPESWKYYYRPVFEYVRLLRRSRKRADAEAEMEVARDIYVDVFPTVFEQLTRSQWQEAKHWCDNNRQMLTDNGYRADGIKLKAGKSWLVRFEEPG